MEALTTNVSYAASAVHHRDLHLLKPPSNHHPLPGAATNFKVPSSNSLFHQPLSHLSRPRSPPQGPQRPKASAATSRGPIHRSAATGYAAALLDAARCAGALGAVERDVRRFARIFRAVERDPSIVEGRKGVVLKASAEGGGFDRRVAALVGMLVGKQMVATVGEVMEAFGRILDELRGTRVVVVSSERRMEEPEQGAEGERSCESEGEEFIWATWSKPQSTTPTYFPVLSVIQKTVNAKKTNESVNPKDVQLVRTLGNDFY